jgi:hypothetical protein
LEEYGHCKDPDFTINGNPLDRYEINFQIGPKFGFQIGKFNFSESAYYSKGDYTSISGPVVGIVGVVHLSDNLFIQTELAYIKKKSKSDYVNTYPPDSTVYSKVELDLTYVDWPLYVGYSFLKGKVQPFLGAGVNFGFLVTGGIQDDPIKVRPEDDGPPFVDFNEYDFGLVFLAGVNIQIKKSGNFQFYIKYVDSSSDYIVMKNSDILGGYGAGSSNLNTKRFEFCLAYLFSTSEKKIIQP